MKLRIVTVTNLAKHLGLPSDTVRAAARDGLIPSHSVAGRRVVLVDEIPEELLDDPSGYLGLDEDDEDDFEDDDGIFEGDDGIFDDEGDLDDEDDDE